MAKGMIHYALSDGNHNGVVARGIHAHDDLPRVDVDYVHSRTGPTGVRVACSPDDVIAAMTDLASAPNGLARCGLAIAADGRFDPVSFPATEENLAALKAIVQAITSADGAVSHAIAGRRETIAPFRNAMAMLLVSPYLGYAYRDNRHDDAPEAKAFVGLFGSAVVADQELTSFAAGLKLLGPHSPSREGDNKDESETFDGISLEEWGDLAAALAIAAPETRAAIQTGDPLRVVLSSKTSRHDCRISFIATDRAQHRDWEVGVHDEIGAIVNALEARPLLKGHRSTVAVGFKEAFAVQTRASAFSIKPRQIQTVVLDDTASATLRASAKARLLAPERLEAARATIAQTVRRIAPQMERLLAGASSGGAP